MKIAAIVFWALLTGQGIVLLVLAAYHKSLGMGGCGLVLAAIAGYAFATELREKLDE